MGYKVRMSRAISYLNYVNTGLLSFITLKDTALFSNLNQYVLLLGIGSVIITVLLTIGWLEDILGFHRAEVTYNMERNNKFIGIEQKLELIHDKLEKMENEQNK